MSDKHFSLALVTGASSGIGEDLCDLLASKKIDLIINGRNSAKLKDIAQKLNPHVNVTVVEADLTQHENRREVLEAIYKYTPDLIINNAGLGFYGEALSYETESQMEILSVNAEAVLEITLEGARAMISCDKRGVILNVSSVAGTLPTFPCFSVYAASKAFVNHVSRSLDYELRPYGVRVLSACPGVVATQFRRRAAGGEEPAPNPSFRVKPMSPSYAAEQIWKQIKRRRSLHIFDWKYRLSSFVANYLLPKSWLSQRLAIGIESLHPPRPIIKRKNSL